MEFILTKADYDKNYLDEIIEDVFNWGIANIHKEFRITVKDKDEVVTCLRYENLWHFLYEEPYKEYFSEKFLKENQKQGVRNES